MSAAQYGLGYDGPPRTFRETAAQRDAAARLAERRRGARFEPRINALMPLIERGEIDAMNEFTALIAERERITVEVLDPWPTGHGAAYALPLTRTIAAPLIRVSDSIEERFRKFADRLH